MKTQDVFDRLAAASQSMFEMMGEMLISWAVVCWTRPRNHQFRLSDQTFANGFEKLMS